MPVAILGAVATLLGNFVGAIYVKMYAESTKSLTAFHNRLVGTHHMHYGAYLATRIVDEPELLNETWSKMAIGTVPKGPDAAEKPEQKGEGVSGPAAESDSLAKFLEKVLERISEKRGKEDT